MAVAWCGVRLSARRAAERDDPAPPVPSAYTAPSAPSRSSRRRRAKRRVRPCTADKYRIDGDDDHSIIMEYNALAECSPPSPAALGASASLLCSSTPERAESPERLLMANAPYVTMLPSTAASRAGASLRCLLTPRCATRPVCEKDASPSPCSCRASSSVSGMSPWSSSCPFDWSGAPCSDASTRATPGSATCSSTPCTSSSCGVSPSCLSTSECSDECCDWHDLPLARSEPRVCDTLIALIELDRPRICLSL